MSAERCYTTPLTPQQRAVLRVVCEGKSDKEAARALGLTESTIGIHLHIAFRKLGVRNRTQAALMLVRGEVPQ